jgi:hypothetical protein
MPVPPVFIDEILGRVTWNAEDLCWCFDAGPVYGWSVPAVFIPEESDLSPADHAWDQVRACVRWVRANEPAIRAFLIRMGRRPADEVLCFSEMHFYKDQPARLLTYDGDGMVIVRVNAVGQILSDLTVIGWDL